MAEALRFTTDARIALTAAEINLLRQMLNGSLAWRHSL